MLHHAASASVSGPPTRLSATCRDARSASAAVSPSPPMAPLGAALECDLPRPPPRLHPASSGSTAPPAAAAASTFASTTAASLDLGVYERQIGALSQVVASQQAQISELLALVRASSQNQQGGNFAIAGAVEWMGAQTINSPTAAAAAPRARSDVCEAVTSAEQVLRYAKMESRPVATRSLRVGAWEQERGGDSAETRATTICQQQQRNTESTHATAHPFVAAPSSSTDAAGAAAATLQLPPLLRDAVERLCLETLTARLVVIDERLAMAVADRIRRVTHDHVLRSVDRMCRRVLRDATLDRDHPAADLLAAMKRRAAQAPARWTPQRAADATASASTALDLPPPSGRANMRHAPVVSDSLLSWSSSASDDDDADDGDGDAYGHATRKNKHVDMFDVKGVSRDIAARAALQGDRRDAAPRDLMPHSSGRGDVPRAVTARPTRRNNGLNASTAETAPHWGDRVSRGAAQHHGMSASALNTSVASAASAAAAVGFRGVSKGIEAAAGLDVVGSIARLKHLVETLEVAD
jgi:hypothetical protein